MTNTPPQDDAADFRQLVRDGVPERRLGQTVRRVREARGISQEQLAAAMGREGFPMHQTTLAKLEQAGRPIRVNELYALSIILGLPVAYLLGLDDSLAAAIDRYTRAVERTQAISGELEVIEEFIWNRKQHTDKLAGEILKEMDDFSRSVEAHPAVRFRDATS